jgi:hypothetical protein
MTAGALFALAVIGAEALYLEIVRGIPHAGAGVTTVAAIAHQPDFVADMAG